MAWRPDGPQGNEAAKIRFDVLPYLRTGVDLGCGAAKVWPHLMGIDSGKDGVLFGTPVRPDMVVRTVERLPMFADGCFESVFSSHTLEHLADTRAALAEWWRLVAPGGHLVLYLPHADLYPNIGQPGANPDHKHDFRNEDIVAAMRAVAPDWELLLDEKREGGDEYSFLQVYRKAPAGSGHRYPCNVKPAKSAGVVRVGGHGDALWASSVCAHLKEQGYHVTAYVGRPGAEVLRHDPNIDRLVELPEAPISDEDELQLYATLATRHDRWVNLIGSVERRLLAHESSYEFFLPHAVRHRFMNANYLETVHAYAGLPPSDFRQKFHASAEEKALVAKLRSLLPGPAGPVVVINPSGSGPVKYWPHSQRLMELLAARGVYGLVLGDVRDDKVVGCDPFGIVVGMELPIRIALAYALSADAVVATESAIANAVAFEPMLKVITLSHSSNENLTKHWINTAAIEPQGLACHPCHRVHPTNFNWCSRDKATGASACQALAGPEPIAELVLDWLERTGKLPAKAAA